MLNQNQLLWLILLLNTTILLYLLSGTREGYSNFAAKRYHWSDRTGQNNIMEGNISGFGDDAKMFPYQVYGQHAPFVNLLEDQGRAASESGEL